MHNNALLPAFRKQCLYYTQAYPEPSSEMAVKNIWIEIIVLQMQEQKVVH